jgi:sugar/nucleoside kinase (ribokinase family)
MGLAPAEARARMREGAVLVQTAGVSAASATGAFGAASRTPRAIEDGDPLGAGDAFSAGLLLELLDAGEAAPRDEAFWERALRRGHAVSLAHLRRRV